MRDYHALVVFWLPYVGCTLDDEMLACTGSVLGDERSLCIGGVLGGERLLCIGIVLGGEMLTCTDIALGGESHGFYQPYLACDHGLQTNAVLTTHQLINPSHTRLFTAVVHGCISVHLLVCKGHN